MTPRTALGALGATGLVLALPSVLVGAATLTPDLLVQSRLPRLAAVALSGAGLALAGLLLQQLSANRFVSPDTASTVEWGSLGFLVGLVALPQAPLVLRTLLSFIAALVGTLVFLGLASRVAPRGPLLVPVLGLGLGVAVNAGTTSLAWSLDQVQSLAAWTHGDFSLVVEGRWELLWIIVPTLGAALWFSDALTVAGLGEDPARSLGLPYRLVVVFGVALAALLTASVLAVGGVIPFLGLVIPNLVTRIWGDHLRTNLPLAAAGGAVFLVACDLVGRLVVFPFEIPLGVTAGLVGAGVFLAIHLTRGGRRD